MCKSTAGDSVQECFGRETRESTGGAGGERTNMRNVTFKRQIGFYEPTRKEQTFSKFPNSYLVL